MVAACRWSVAEGVIAVVVDLTMWRDQCFLCRKTMVRLQLLNLIGPTRFVPHARRKNRL